MTLGGASEGDDTIQSGGALSTGALTVASATGNLSANGSLSVSGGAFSANTLTVGAGSAGALVQPYSGSVSINAGSGAVTGQTIVADAAGSLQHYGGSLSLDNGARFTTGGLVIGNQPGSVGQVTVSGTSNLTSTQNLVVGASGTGSISVGNEATVAVNNGAGTVVAENPSAVGSTISATGSGSIFAAGSSLTLGQAPGTSPFVSATYGGLVEIGSPTGGLGAGGGLAMASNGLLDLTVGPGQQTADIATSGTLQLGGVIQVDTSATAFFSPAKTPNDFIPLIEGSSINGSATNLMSPLPDGVATGLGSGFLDKQLFRRRVSIRLPPSREILSVFWCPG